MTVAFSTEIDRANMSTAPPYADACPECPGARVVLAPVVLLIEGTVADALYRHRKCGREWSCCWTLWDGSSVDHP